MSRQRFRFRPPSAEPPRELAWVLTRAFAPLGASCPPPDPGAALALAHRVALLPRLAVRGELSSRSAELGAAAGERLRGERALAAARELRFDETLAVVTDAARRVGTELAPLKGRALVLAGETPPGARPSGDLDLLAPHEALAPLHAELRRRGFVAAGGVRHAHELPPLRHPASETVELHRYLPGVRVTGRRSATWSDLASAGLLAAPAASAPGALVRLPARDARIAHALVHALAQHGLTARHPGWLLIGDLIDLRALDPGGDAARWRRWIARDLTPAEIDAALALAAAAAAGRDPFAVDSPSDARALARHFVACAVDPDYGEALKTRWLESPVSEGTRFGARARRLWQAFVPPAERSPSRFALARRAGRWLARPFVLVAKALRATTAARRLAAHRDETPPL